MARLSLHICFLFFCSLPHPLPPPNCRCSAPATIITCHHTLRISLQVLVLQMVLVITKFCSILLLAHGCSIECTMIITHGTFDSYVSRGGFVLVTSTLLCHSCIVC
ncbi:hypothetical protein CY34DRAFT_806457 [Suillus luteus UH-Slu-Lm8-n1]|uniref:Secreted protein n=1 Tax=Suillus luteus UH-Slu-Lm8-n1 TaxID=930992 RepID=A0A0D0ASX0_9AGAM|nr:hypothetical protein CY34DRAFT_806457 [Suillus luteus UH-Slu-Lm8-n1]